MTTKTVKFVLDNVRAKCLLKDYGPIVDFEIGLLFYSGLKMARTVNGLQITEPNGKKFTLALNNEEPQLDRESTSDLWNHLKECLVHCERIEAGVNQLTVFPVGNSSLPFFSRWTIWTNWTKTPYSKFQETVM